MGDPTRLASLVAAQVQLMAEDAAEAAARGDRIIVLAPLDNLTAVYCLIACVGGDDPESPDAHGEYIIKLSVPADYPASPPRFIAVTPNGVFMAGTAICVSIGEFHQSAWRPALGLAGFAREIYGAFVCFTRSVAGIGVKIVDRAERRRLALESRAWNEQNQPEVLAALRAAAPPAALDAIDRAALGRDAALARSGAGRARRERSSRSPPPAKAGRREPAGRPEPAAPPEPAEIAPPADYGAFFG